MPKDEVTFTRAGLSRGRVNGAGDLLRDYMFDASIDLDDRHLDSYDVIGGFRREFQEPLTSVVMGLRSMVRTEEAPVIVGQRLKRMPQIIKKLVRYPGMDLSNMQDIGGCRAILPDQASVERVRRRIVRNRWDIRGMDDYVTRPRSTGYRAVHVRVKRAGRLIEIQLRTPSQHNWAEGVEGIDLRKTYGLKDGSGPMELVTALERSAYAMEQESLGITLGDEFDAQFAAFRNAARRFL